jgi:hypothetical protein
MYQPVSRQSRFSLIVQQEPEPEPEPRAMIRFRFFLGQNDTVPVPVPQHCVTLRVNLVCVLSVSVYPYYRYGTLF